MKKKVAEDLKNSGRAAPNLEKPWDSNVITPGTAFMLRLSSFIRFFVEYKVSTDEHWGSITVLFSDASIPGEGEHKIMSLVRTERAQPDYDPNISHVLHGLDADLIMLALATHEANFFILREEVTFGGRRDNKEAANDQRKRASGFHDIQTQLNEATGSEGMASVNQSYKPVSERSELVTTNLYTN